MLKAGIQNPWLHLPEAQPYFLEDDKPFIEEFNRKSGEDFRFDGRLLPEPFWGNPSARVVLLLLNPGIGPGDHEMHSKEQFIRSLRSSCSDLDRIHSPHLLFPGECDGKRWWKKITEPLAREVGEHIIHEQFFCIQFIGYHSKRFGSGRINLPSQEFSFKLLKSFMEKGACVVLMRSDQKWMQAVPELKGYEHLVHVKNKRRPYISRKNVGDKAFMKIFEFMGQGAC